MPTADIRFTCESLIKGLLQKDSIFDSFEIKFNFRIAILEFIESNYDILLSEKILDSCLDDVFITRWKRNDRDAYISLLDRICLIAEKDISTLNTYLIAMGRKSSIISDKEAQITLLREIIAKSENSIGDPTTQHIHCVASYNLAELLSETSAIELINNTDLIIKKQKGVKLHVISLKTKSIVLRNLSDDKQKINWFNEITKSILSNIESITAHDVIEIASNLAKLPKDFLEKAENSYNFLFAVYEKYKYLDFSYCEHALWMIDICLALSLLSNNPIQTVEYYNNIKTYRKKIPLDCEKIKYVQYVALCMYCEIPITLLPDLLKIEEIKQFKKDFPTEEEFVQEIVIIAYNAGDANIYRNCPELTSEVTFCEMSKQLSEGYNMYEKKNFVGAEKLFAQLINCGYDEIEMNARNNLAFMLRRKETCEIQEPFLNIMNPVPDSLIFKHMNTVLYCISEGLTTDTIYTNAINKLNEMTTEDKAALYRCWSNTSFVGEEESNLALGIIAECSKNKTNSQHNSQDPSLNSNTAHQLC